MLASGLPTPFVIACASFLCYSKIAETALHTKEQWVYAQGYIYLTDGIVTAIQISEWVLNTNHPSEYNNQERKCYYEARIGAREILYHRRYL